MYPDLQKIKARLTLLGVAPHPLIADGSYSIYTLTGESALGEPYWYDISFVSPFSLKVEALVDRDVHVLLEDEKNASEKREIYGKIYHASEESMIDKKYLYKVKVVHPLYYLNETKRYEIYQEMNTVEIIQKIVLMYAGLLDLEFEPHIQPGVKREYTTQYAQSDLHFIQMLCQEEGITLHLAGGSTPYKVILDNINDSFLPLAGTLECHFNLSKSFKASHMQEDYYDFKAPSLEYSYSIGESALSQTLGDNSQTSQLRNDLKQYRLRDRLEEKRDSELKRYSKQDSLQGYAHAEVIYGSSESMLTIEGHGGVLSEPKTIKEVDAILTKVSYEGFFPNALEEHKEEVSSQHTQQFTCTFEAVPMGTHYIPPRTVVKPVIPSTVTAIVSGGTHPTTPGENTIDIDQFSRIRVVFHFDPQYPTSCYIRFSNFSAGNGWGSQFIPRVNTEVIVSFLNGDPDRPVAIGSLYNGENQIPQSLPANKTKSYIKTQSLPGGSDNYNMLSFEDKGGSEMLQMQAEKDFDILIKHDSNHVIGHDEQAAIGHDRSENVGHDETISIGNNRTETVGVDETISIGSNQGISVGANRQESVGKNESVQIGKNQSLKVGKNRSIKVGKNHNETIGMFKIETVALGKMESIGMAKMLSVGLGYQVSVGAVKSETVGGNSMESVSASKSTSVSSDYSESVGKKKSIVAGERCEITVGGSSLIMNADGTIIIQCKKLKLAGSEQVEVNGKVIDLN